MDKSFDFLILGAGLGGLECAFILSKKGYKVGVLEKNEHIGGTLQNFKLGESTFSAGMHYLGSLDEGQLLHRLFRFFNILDKLKLKRMNPEVFDRFIIQEQQIDYPMGWEYFSSRMNAYFPAEKKAIKEYVSLMTKVSASQAIYNLQAPDGYDIRQNPYHYRSIYQEIKSLTSNRNLQHALTALNFVYAGDRETSSLYTHALINNYYIQSAYRLLGGSQQIATHLADNIKSQGGVIHTRKKVNSFIFQDHKLTGVETREGVRYTGKQIISNIHPAVTLEMVPEGKIRKSFRDRIASIPQTMSVFGLHLRLKPGRIPYVDHNVYYYANDDVWPVTTYKTDEWPSSFYLYTPAAEGQGAFADAMSIYTYMSFDEVSKWSSRQDRGEDYQEWKRSRAEKLIQLASKYLPGLKDAIHDYITATPLTYRDYIGTPEGAMYGTLRDYKNPMASYIFTRTKIPNLYFTGQNINLHGMLGVSISALLTCGEILGIDELMKEVTHA
ncbi:MAG: NAD(P)/FAD-dependent oxidoreductase [bacterium]